MISDDKYNVGTLKLNGNFNWKVVANICLKLDEAGFQIYFNWSQDGFDIELYKNRPLPTTEEIRKKLLLAQCRDLALNETYTQSHKKAEK